MKQFFSQKHGIFITMLLINQVAFTQVLKPVKWTYTINRINDCEADLIFTANIEKGFHIYSQFLDRDDGPVATTFNCEKSIDYNLQEKVLEGKPHEEYDANFEMKLKYFSEIATFKQKIKITNLKAFNIKGYVNFMVCDGTKCLPPEDANFEFKIAAASGKPCPK